MSSPDPNSSGPQNSDDVATETGVQVELPAVGAAAAADEPRTAARPAAGSTAGSVLAVDDIEGGDREASADADSSFAGMRRREMSVPKRSISSMLQMMTPMPAKPAAHPIWPQGRGGEFEVMVECVWGGRG